MLVGKLEGFNQSKRFVNTAAYRKVVDRRLSHRAMRIDDERATECNATGSQNVIRGGDRFVQVTDQWIVATTETTLLTCRFNPAQVGEFAINAASKHLRIESSKALRRFRKRDDFSWADERKIERVEEQVDPLALVVRQADRLVLLQIGRAHV